MTLIDKEQALMLQGTDVAGTRWHSITFLSKEAERTGIILSVLPGFVVGFIKLNGKSNMVHLRMKAVVASEVKSPIQSRTLNQRVITSLGEKSPLPSHRRLLCSQNQQEMSLFTRKHWTGWGARCWTLVTEHTPLPPVATVSTGCKPVTYLAFLKPSLFSGRRLNITQGPGGTVGRVA